MSTNYKRWQMLFLFSLGLFIGSSICMKWIEPALLQNGRQFTVIGLEISYSKEKLMTILAGLDSPVRTLLRYHLSFDFVFMAGVYPGIAALCMMARYKTAAKSMRNILLGFAALQIVAWSCDIVENCYLFKWIKNPVIGNDLGSYHLIAYSKWFIALAGIIMALLFIFRKRRW